MAKVEAKKPVVDEISGILSDAKAVVLADYRGLTVEQDTQLRRQLREAGVHYKVYKNTLIRFAVKDTPYEPLVAHLEGPTVLASSSTDETAPARILYDFAKTAPVLELKAGVVDGVYYDTEGINVIATIPGRDVLLGRLLGSMQAPIANLARVLDQIAEAKAEGRISETAPAAEAPAEEAPAAEAPAEEAPAAE